MSATKRTSRYALLASGLLGALVLTAFHSIMPPTRGASSTDSMAAQDLVADPGFVDVLAASGDARGRQVRLASATGRDGASDACAGTCSCECD